MTENLTTTPWFYTIEPSKDGRPWQNWVKALRFPRHCGPLDAEIEHAVENAIAYADARRIAVGSTLPMIWQSFRKRHGELDESWEYRRKRYLIWRAAALATMLQRGDYQDEADAAMIRDKLASTYAEFGPLDPDGRYGSYCLWRPRTPDDPLESYAADVLALFEVAIAKRRVSL